ncbi:MAG: hypothetical protein OXH47_10095 [Paracoccaceae bacterium]|nr:hypothetical protein [Paracoccaceae bacterium]
MDPFDLVQTARALARLDQGRPRQVNLKRALSTAYYARFHALCLNCANSFIGTEGAARSEPAWNQVYRSVDHAFAKKQCKNQEVMASFPEAIRRFANYFVNLQDMRHQADYDPARNFDRREVLNAIDHAEGMLKNLLDSDLRVRKAFAAWIAVRNRYR